MENEDHHGIAPDMLHPNIAGKSFCCIVTFSIDINVEESSLDSHEFCIEAAPI